MNENYYAVIMAGGIGSRFWPVSRKEFPKQFHDMLGSGQSLLQKTYSRLNKIIPSENIFILTNARYLDITLQQLPEITKEQVVLEPAMRNTAPCILLSSLKIHKKNSKALMLVAPSDHWIEDEEAYVEDVEIAFSVAAPASKLMTLGIEPTFPNTGYGYIESRKSGDSIERVIQFREKPDYKTAKEFVASGNFFWNTGIFLWSTQSILDAFKTHLPEMYDLFAKGLPMLNTPEENRFIDDNYAKSENISIDYGIMEKEDNVYVKKATFDWNDLGTWGSLYDKIKNDHTGNAVINAETFMTNSKNNMVFSTSEKLIVLDGIDDYIIVDSEDILLVYPKKKEQDIKELLKRIEGKYGNKFS